MYRVDADMVGGRGLDGGAGSSCTVYIVDEKYILCTLQPVRHMECELERRRGEGDETRRGHSRPEI